MKIDPFFSGGHSPESRGRFLFVCIWYVGIDKTIPNLLKRVIIIIPITKDEAMFMRTRKKVHITKPTRHGKRFMEERADALALLREYRAGKYPMGGKK